MVPVDSSAAKIPGFQVEEISKEGLLLSVAMCPAIYTRLPTFARGNNCLGNSGKLLLQLLRGVVEVGCHPGQVGCSLKFI